MSVLATKLSRWRSDLERRQGSVDALRTRKSKHEADLLDLSSSLLVKEEALEVCKAIEAAWQRSFEQDLADVVSQGLTLVFEKPIELGIESSFQRQQSAVTFVLHEDGLKTQILGSKGGGYVNVVTFLLRTLLLLNARPPLRKLLVLDEAFAEVSAEYVPNVATLLRQLCDQTGVQIILVTHEPAFGEYADFVYQVTMSKGVSSVELVQSDNCKHLFEGDEDE